MAQDSNPKKRKEPDSSYPQDLPAGKRTKGSEDSYFNLSSTQPQPSARYNSYNAQGGYGDPNAYAQGYYAQDPHAGYHYPQEGYYNHHGGYPDAYANVRVQIIL